MENGYKIGGILNQKRQRKSPKRLIRVFSRFIKSVRVMIKNRLVYGLFWSRSTSYKKYSHIVVLVITLIVFISGITTKLGAVEYKRLNFPASSNPGNVDLLEQGSDIQTVLTEETTNNLKITRYKVKSGDTLESVAAAFNVTQQTIIESNLDVIEYYSPSISEGDTILIPEIVGVLIPVGPKDNADGVMSRLTKGNKIDVIEINNLEPPDYNVGDRKYVFVPDGVIIAPPKPAPIYPDVVYANGPNDGAPIPAASLAALNGISFINPLSHPSCAGYVWSRGFSSWHNAADLAKAGGCETRAVASGTVVYSGWEPYGGGYAITIDHGNGVQTVYYHHASLYVKAGQQVYQGQEIGYMGCTGLCTGTHLHIGLRVNYQYIDPAGYIPY